MIVWLIGLNFLYKNEKGNREIIGLDLSSSESEYSWSNFFEYLKARGLSGLNMVISDSIKV